LKDKASTDAKTFHEMECRAYRQNIAMKGLLGLMIAHEIEFGKAMKQSEIKDEFLFPGIDTETLLQEMLDRGFIASSFVLEAREDYDRGQKVTINDVWSTTSFGREWFHSGGGAQEGRNAHFFFAHDLY
jgi:hypothetical protein